MKGNNKRILALILAASMMALCLCGCGSVAAAGNSAAASADASSESGSAASSAESSAEYESVPATGDKLEKDETVYVICNADGSVSKVIVSDWLKNGTKADQITDQTDLQDLEVVKGNATYTMDSDNMTIWDTKSGDVFYKGTSTKDLPVNVAVSYQLDGQDISAEDLAGKSGKVTIRFDYTNTQYEMVDVNGTQTKIYVPFVVLTGMVLDNEKFSDIAVSNGKLVSTGDDTMVIGFAMPGMQDSLNISKDDLEIPDYVELTADVTDFSLDTVMTLASAKFTSDVSDDDISSLETTAGVDNLDTLPDSLSQLTDAMKQLTDGSDELYTNMQTLLEKTNELATGVQELAAAVKQLDSGSATLYDGSVSLRDNLKTLQTGLGKLSGSSASLNAGAKQVFQSLLDQANAQIKASGASIPTLTIDNYDQVLSSVSVENVTKTATATAKTQVTAKVKANETAITTAVTQGVQVGVTAKVLSAATQGKIAVTVPDDATQDQLKQIGAQLTAAVGQLTADQQKAVTDAVAAQMATADVQKLIASKVAAQEELLIEQGMSSAEVTSAISSAVASAKAGESTLSTLKKQLDSYNQFYQGLATYTAGVDSAYAGSQKLSAGADQLAGGCQTLSASLAKLDTAVASMNTQVSQMPDGVSKLTDGAMQLSDGLQELNDKGMSKLEKLMGNDLTGLKDRVEALRQVGDDYNNYSGIAEGMDGSVQFVFKTASIGDQD
jgi:putative membrane protein